jgi:hypothetical protein
MPTLPADQQLQRHQYPPLFAMLLKGVLHIFKGEQLRLKDSGEEVVNELIRQFVAYAYNKEPFRSHVWNRETKPLPWWTALSHDSNAYLIAVRSPCSFLALATYFVSSRKLPSRYFLFLLLRSVTSVPRRALDGLTLLDEAR